MHNFHEDKIWQESYVALMDIYEATENIRSDEIIVALVVSAQNVTAKIADGLSRNDKRIGRDLIYDAIGLVAVTRTQLAIAWGRGKLNDETFRALDDKYANLSGTLQRYK